MKLEYEDLVALSSTALASVDAIITQVNFVDPNPDPPNLHLFGLPDPDPEKANRDM